MGQLANQWLQFISSLYICAQLLSAHLLDLEGYDYQTQPINKRNAISTLTDLENIKPFLKFDNKLNPINQGMKNGKIILQCRVSASPPAIISWQFHKTDGSLEQRNRISRGGYLQNWVSKFPQKIGNSIESYENDGEEKFNFIINPRNLRSLRSLRSRRETVNVEDDYNDESPLVSKNDEKGEYSPRQLGLSVTQSRLELDCLDEEDAGTYECVAENAVKIIKQSTILKIKESDIEKCEAPTGVKARPNFYPTTLANDPQIDIIAANGKREKPKLTPARIYMWTKNRVENQGTNVRIFCRSSGAPKPLKAWMSPGGKTLHNSSKYKILKNGDLYIKNISWEHDMGLYICLVNNKYGFDHKEAFLYPLNPEASDE